MNQSSDSPPSFPSDDPYLRWHFSTEFRYWPEGYRWVPVLIRLKAGVSANDFWLRDWRTDRPFADALAVPKLYEGKKPSGYITVFVWRDDIRSVCDHAEWRARVDTFYVGQPVDGALSQAELEFWPTGQPTEQEPSISVAKVVVAVIDDGIAFANSRFFDQNGKTRIRAFRNLDSTQALDGAAIEAAIAQHRHGSLVDDEALYAATGLDPYGSPAHKRVAQRRSHGTHVLDIAAALPVGTQSDQFPIIAVQLPRSVVSDPSGTNLGPELLNALEFIENRMEGFETSDGQTPPLVVNISYGMFGGPQDGSSYIEEAIDSWVKMRNATARRTEVVIAAGNTRLVKGHAVVPVVKSVRNIAWRVLPEDRTPSALEIWVPKDAKVRVQIKDPIGSPTAWIGEGNVDMTLPCTIDYSAPPTPSGRRLVLVRLLPTANASPFSGVQTARSGVWTVRIRADGAAGFNVDLYVQRDDVPLGYKSGAQQSILEDRHYAAVDSAGRPKPWDGGAPSARRVLRAGTLNAIGTGQQPLLAAAYRRRDRTSCTYSSLGASKSQRCPDVATIGDDSLTGYGVLAAGNRSGSTVAVNGTSVAAAQLTRFVIDAFDKHGPLNEQDLRDLIASSASSPTGVPAAYKKQAVGVGVLPVKSVTYLKSGGALDREIWFP